MRRIKRAVSQRERDVESQYDYFGARYYDARIGRWLAADPLAQKYASISPFSYCANNPIQYLDPDGRRVINHHYNAILGFLGLKQSPQYYATQNLIDQARTLNPELYSRVDASPSRVEIGVGSVEQDPAQSSYRPEAVSVNELSVQDNKATEVTITIDLETIKKAAAAGWTNEATYEEVDLKSTPVLKVVHGLAHADKAITDYKGYRKSKESEAFEAERKANEILKQLEAVRKAKEKLKQKEATDEKK